MLIDLTSFKVSLFAIPVLWLFLKLAILLNWHRLNITVCFSFRYLEDLHDAGENASDFLNLFKVLIKSPEWKRHLVACGILERVTELIVKVIRKNHFHSFVRISCQSCQLFRELGVR